jgi:hypothetical protein
MRFLLIPAEIQEWCNLHGALQWVHARLYPIDDQFLGVQELVNDAVCHLWHDEERWAKELEDAREGLLAALMTGQVSATGILEQGRPALASGDGPFENIPREYWRSKRVDWRGWRLETPRGAYSQIGIDTEQLLKQFPEPPRIEVTVEKAGSVFLWDDGAPKRRRGGRPPTYDWPKFHAAVTRMALQEGRLPPTQAELERKMLEWCEDHFGQEPALSLVRHHLAPYFDGDN